MSRIHSKNTSLEVKFRKLLIANGIKGYRLHYKLEGKPDLVFVNKKIAIFIDGCFWHKCKKHFVAPKTKKSFWLPKIEKNITRDKLVNKILRRNGWKVLRFWEHEVDKKSERVLRKISSLVSV